MGAHSLEASGKSAGAIEAPGKEDAAYFGLAGLPLVLVMMGLVPAIFLMSLDPSVIAVAVQRITSQFNSTADIGWYGSAYSFAMCALQPVTGKLFSNFSIKVSRQVESLGASLN